MAMTPGYPPTQTNPPPTMPMYPPQPMMMVGMPTPKTARLLWGSVLRIVGAIIGGVDLIWLGLWLSNPAGMINLFNPLAPFQTLGAIIALAGVSVIFTGVGWSIQSWGRGL